MLCLSIDGREEYGHATSKVRQQLSRQQANQVEEYRRLNRRQQLSRQQLSRKQLYQVEEYRQKNGCQHIFLQNLRKPAIPSEGLPERTKANIFS